MIFISFIFRTEKINFSQILGLILSITGVAIIVTRLDFAKLINQNISNKTKSIWHPALDRTQNSLLRWVVDDSE